MGLVDISKRLATVEAQSDYVRRWVTENSSLLTSVSAFDKRISDLEGTGKAFTDGLMEFVTTIRNDGNGLPFVFFTDPHDMSGFEDFQVLEHMTFVRTLYENSPAQYVLCGGDWLNTHHTLAAAKYRGGRVPNLIRNRICEKAYTVIGNHDLNVEAPDPTGAYLTEPQLAKLWYDSDVGYYTIDTSETRCFMFDSGDQSKPMTSYRWTQVDWFANLLLTNTKPHLFGLIHIIGNATSDESGVVRELGENLTLLANAFNQRQSITLNGHTYDYSTATGTFHYMLSGHYHKDYSTVINNIPVVYTTSGYAVDCCYADFSDNVIHLTRISINGGYDQNLSRTLPIVPTGGYQVSN